MDGIETSQDPDPDTVRWVASQGSTNPALRALIREAAQDTSPPTRPPARATPCRPWQPSATPHAPPRPARTPADEPEARLFIQMLQTVSKQLDENSQRKQRLAARARRTLALTKTASLDRVPAKSPPASLPHLDLSPSPAHPPKSATYPTLVRRGSTPEPTSDEDDCEMHDLTSTTDDTSMDTSFFLPPTRVVAHPPPRPRSGPPPLGMRRAPQPSQYTQAPKGPTVPRFKPPLLTRAAGLTAKPAAASSTEDPDSSFDVSFDMDPDVLEKTMRAYDRR